MFILILICDLFVHISLQEKNLANENIKDQTIFNPISMDRNMQHRHQRASNARLERNKAGKAKSNTLEKQATTGTGLDTATIITTMPTRGEL